MTNRGTVLAGTVLVATALALLTASVAVRIGLWDRPVEMDNRLYFYLAERAASGVAPHLSSPDVKSQLSTLADASAISLGRGVGLHDVRAGRVGELVFLIVGIWGVASSVRALGAGGSAALLAGLSVLGFSNLVGHVVVGFNPKILLFTFLAWGPWLLARGHFAWAGAAATAAMLCWQPAGAACVATALGALAGTRRVRALTATMAGGIAAFALYESYFAWHGVLAAQLFQTWALPFGSVHDETTDWLRGARFVILGSRMGIDRYGIPGVSFVLFVLGALVRLAGFRGSRSVDRSAPAVALVATAGSMVCLFTAYEHQAEPDRFLLVAYFAIAFGVVVDTIVRFLGTRLGQSTGPRAQVALEVALAAVLLSFVPHRAYKEAVPAKRLAGQIESAAVVAMVAEAYGSVWSYGCFELMGMAHLANHHPLDHIWDDLRRYVDERAFVPLAHDRLPDAIVRCRRLPGSRDLLKQYTAIRLPGLAQPVHLFVRNSAFAPQRRNAVKRR